MQLLLAIGKITQFAAAFTKTVNFVLAVISLKIAQSIANAKNVTDVRN